MSIRVAVEDHKNGRTAKIGLGGALATGPSSPSTPFNATLDIANTPVNVVPGKGGKIFCVTAIILTGNKGIDVNTDAVVDIYTADDPLSATAITTILNIPVQRSGQTIMTGILLESGLGNFINGKTSDDDVLVTILGFYV